MFRHFHHLLLALVVAAPVFAADSTRLVPVSTSRLLLEGSSNVAPWRCSGATLDARVEVAAPLQKINAVIDRIEDGNIAVWMSNPAAGRFPQPSFQLRIPVNTLRCGNGRMERDMQRALRAELHPTIEFRFIRLIGGVTHDIDAGNYHATIAGQLSLAGETRNITLKVAAERLAHDRFRLQAVLPLRMTDFEITPPTALFGAIKAKNELTVRFDLDLRATAKATRS